MQSLSKTQLVLVLLLGLQMFDQRCSTGRTAETERHQANAYTVK